MNLPPMNGDIAKLKDRLKSRSGQFRIFDVVLKWVSVWRLHLPEARKGKQMLPKIEPSSRIDGKRTKMHH